MTGTTLDFAELFDQARPRLLAVARRVVRNDHDAEDVVQQAFLNAMKGQASFEGRAQATSWLYRITYNTALMHLRHKRRKGATSLDALTATTREAAIERSSPALPASDVLVDIGRLRGRLATAVAGLSDLDQNIVRLRLELGYSTKETADQLGISTAATKTRLHRARGQLQGLLSNVGPALS